MRGCFPAVRRPALPPPREASSKPAGTGTSSPASKPPLPTAVVVDEDDVLYPPREAEPAVADAARLSTAIASRRFFLASPGRSISIVDSAEHPRGGGLPQPRPIDDDDNATRALRRAATNAFVPKRAPPPRLRYDDIHAVQVTSGAPRADFLESMVEMAGAMGVDPRRGAADVAALQELLLCYIAVNDHDALTDIIGAYADLLGLFGGDDAGAPETTAA
ncbi:hypothetical protein QOZ80_2AG0125360 [Eleusine coracana subsp. coracana]|nr:hypothetical protein QOZ80_2AG0125360 [Eleusine coracana subsp. coracana]